MSKAMAVQTAKYGGAAAPSWPFSSQPKTSRAKIHTSRNQEAKAAESPVLRGRDKGERHFTLHFYPLAMLTRNL